jgi:hypothetical protein
MLYIIITAIVLVIVALLVWYYGFRSTGITPSPSRNNIKKVSFNNTSVYPNKLLSTDGMPQSLAPRSSFVIDESPIVETEHRLLQIARAPAVHPEYSTNSVLRQSGNPFVGDIVIKPRTEGVSIPKIASPSDLQQGYFSKISY